MNKIEVFENTTVSEVLHFASDTKQVVFYNCVLNNLTVEIENEIDLAFILVNKSCKASVEIILTKPEANVRINELVFENASCTFEKSILITHQKLRTKSDYYFLGFAFENASITISAKTHIEKVMDGSEAHQHLRLFNDGAASVKAEPGLIIDAHRVKASHGNAIGQISKEEIFYLQTKGFSETQARKIIIDSYLAKIFISLPLPIRSRLTSELSDAGGKNE